MQTATRNLFVCEFKFKRQALGMDVVDEVEERCQVLEVPRGFAPIPVLFHVSGVRAAVLTSDYFYRIIDMSDCIDK